MKALPGTILNNRTIYFLSTFVFLEVLAQTFGFYWQYPVIASIIYFLSGLAVALLPMWQWELPNFSHTPYWIKPLVISTISAITLWCLWRNAVLLTATPLDFKQADMLPVIKTMAQRHLSGEAIYTPIEAIWSGMQPIYLPAMWLPFIPAVGLGIDIRWTSTIFLIFCLGMIFITTLSRSNKSFNLLWLIGLLPVILLYYYIFGVYSTLITLSEEPVVIFYYVLLAWGISRNWPLLTGSALALCLLSRYSLVFWVPMYLIFMYYYQSRVAASKTIITLAVSLILLLTLGQAWEQLDLFLQLQDSYLEELLDERKSWSFIAQINSNPGLIKFLPYSGIATWHQLLIYGSMAIPVLCLLTFRRYRSQLDEQFFGLCSLKLSLVYFYNMLTIPYSYLFYPSTFLSFFILYTAFSSKKVTDGIIYNQDMFS